jgi:hypothetical protein
METVTGKIALPVTETVTGTSDGNRHWDLAKTITGILFVRPTDAEKVARPVTASGADWSSPVVLQHLIFWRECRHYLLLLLTPLSCYSICLFADSWLCVG